ncbi:pentapeptide repeat-containing protein [Nostoc sphaeroides CCNUC1]|uniref:Pentapeptide repeat-containing protein n=2 Tax=Nostoc sphaeroides TaxID=446679 RepID=A0A5P8W6K6_9NOSO|nr:pentapeptide repeat-containing protein [Nostoc sphaeroides CCNUC1]
MTVCNVRHLSFLWISVKNMKLKIVATVALLACFGFAEQALALNQLDLDQLKATSACPRCNLSGADLTKFNLTGANLRGADLSGATLSQANLTNADLTGANLEGAVLNTANLSGASLTGANLKSASLENADLSNAGFISANLEAANLKDAKLQFTNFRGANFRLTTLANGVVTSDMPYNWSSESQKTRECNQFKPENTLGTTCYSK